MRGERTRLPLLACCAVPQPISCVRYRPHDVSRNPVSPYLRRKVLQSERCGERSADCREIWPQRRRLYERQVSGAFISFGTCHGANEGTEEANVRAQARLLCGIPENLPPSLTLSSDPMSELEISSDEVVEKMEEDDDELIYDPDQDPEVVRKVRADYRELAREQDGTEQKKTFM